MSDTTSNNTPQPPEHLAPEDFYYEGPYLVFTREYHLKRGYCCQSNCRHCPYRDQPAPEQNPEQNPEAKP